MIKIYTDGSHLDKINNGRLGCGGVMIDSNNKILGEFSKELKKEWLIDYFGTDHVSNPTAEMLGALTALDIFNIPKNEEVVIYADYTGVKAFCEGTWVAKEPHIKKVKEEINKIIKKKNLKVSFEWVRGHQKLITPGSDAYWNSYVDVLAKGQK